MRARKVARSQNCAAHRYAARDTRASSQAPLQYRRCLRRRTVWRLRPLRSARGEVVQVEAFIVATFESGDAGH